MIKDHHESYICWDEFERNQKQLALNNYGRAGGVKTGRGGRALLSGIMTCGRCGRRLSVAYTGNPQSRPVYRCDKPNLMMGLAVMDFQLPPDMGSSTMLESRSMRPSSRKRVKPCQCLSA
jgi:Recombinase zinc beta ribbon domain